MQIVAAQALPVLNMEYDSASQLWVPGGSRQSYSNGAANLTLVDSSGVPFSNPMSVITANGNGLGFGGVLVPKVKTAAVAGDATQFSTDAGGATMLRMFMGGFTAATAAFLTVGLSTAFNDQVNVKAAIDTFTDVTTGYHAVPTGAMVSNTFSVPVIAGGVIEVQADRGMPWRTWGVEVNVAVSGLQIAVMMVRPA